jgi:pimeloyl-ACP methyl ester carboxylesterase
MNRWNVLVASTLLVVGACAPSSNAQQEEAFATPIVLVHGAWMGAWAYNDVAERIRAEGGSVEAVELPAHGADNTPIAEVSLDTYVAAVNAAIDRAGKPVMLVGHSMAGVVITRVAEEHPENINELVYLAAYMPADGQSLFDLASTDETSHVGPALQIDEENGTGGLPADQLGDIFCADCTEEMIALLADKYRDEPLGPLATPVTVTERWQSVAKTYIFTTEDNAVTYDLQQRMTADVELNESITMETSHSPFLSDPDGVVEALR